MSTKINLPSLADKQNITDKQLSELVNTLSIFRDAGASKTNDTYTEWGVNRDVIVRSLFYIYLFKKYGNSCPIFVSQYVDIALQLIVMDILRGTPSNKTYLRAYLGRVKHCLKRKKLVVIPTRLIAPEGVHANVLIFRRDQRTIEVFEPHGSHYRGGGISDSDALIVYQTIVDLFNERRSAKTRYTLIPSYEVCPATAGLQSLENRSRLIRFAGEGGGYCSVWSMFVTELVLMNPKLSTSQVIDAALKLSRMHDGRTEDYMLSMVRGYVSYVTRQVEKYFTAIMGEKVMDAMRLGNARPDPYFKDIASRKFRVFLVIESELASAKGQSYESLLTKLNSGKWKLPASSKAEVSVFLERLIDAGETKYTPVGRHSPRLVDSLKYRRPCPPGKVRNKRGNCVKPRTKTEVHTAKNARLKPPAKPCPPGKERNPKTGRCRKIVPTRQTKKVLLKLTPTTPNIHSPTHDIKWTTPVLKPCPPGQERNPKTGRCKRTAKITVKKLGANTRKRCPNGYNRNKNTGRCVKKRKKKTLKPCPEGKIRNPKTNRCANPQRIAKS